MDPCIRLKEKLNQKNYDDISSLQELCLETDKTALKLELDFKLNRAENKSEASDNINEFMYFDGDKLIGYIGICCFNGDTVEVNGMVHPEYRRRGVFRKLFSLVKDEWSKRESKRMLLLSDAASASGLAFIKSTKSEYDHSEYEMYLRDDVKHELASGNVQLRKASNRDAKEIARQNCIYFDGEYEAKDTPMPEEEEKCGSVIYMAEIDNRIIGKIHLEISNGTGGIYGFGVLPEYRRKGYGREILVGAIEKLKEKNLKDIMLQVAATNKKALSLYKSCGFEETSTMDYYRLCKGWNIGGQK